VYKSPEDNQRSKENSFISILRDGIEEVNFYIKVTGAQKILRRYFAMNAFDGAMTSLGVVIGAYISGIAEPSSIIGVIIVSSIAMMVSGFSGTYMTESAERSKSLNELENAMLADLNGTIYGKASRFVSIFAAIVDGSAPFIASIPSVIPFILVPSMFSYQTAYYLSIGASLSSLFLLGVYLGRISGGNLVYSGFKMVISGIAVALIAIFINGH
jgi:predicted membrane protein (TIGR00267 family)